MRKVTTVAFYSLHLATGGVSEMDITGLACGSVVSFYLQTAYGHFSVRKIAGIAGVLAVSPAVRQQNLAQDTAITEQQGNV